MKILFALLLAAAPATAADATVSWDAPARYVEGVSYPVELSVQAPEGGATVPAWLLSPAAFSLGGEALGDRKGKAEVALPAGAELTLSFDLGPAIQESKAYAGEDFELALAKPFAAGEPRAIVRYAPAQESTDFMELPAEELDDYLVLMRTSEGEMLMDFWPEVAPEHVRNFLDLAHTGFYEGIVFHRVVPGFMIQAGDPEGTGRGGGPRILKAEFSDRKHVRGVLSMARTNDPDSASSQFFVMHGSAPNLDGQYSAFGKLLDGLDTVDAIAAAPLVPRTDRPAEPPVIQETVVVQKGGAQTR